MTVKEIARFAGKTERAVRNWVNKATEKSSVIAEKSSVSSPLFPADYTIEEVETILKAGSFSDDAVYVLMENAKNAKIDTESISEESVSFTTKQLEMILAANTAAVKRSFSNPNENVVRTTETKKFLPPVKKVKELTEMEVIDGFFQLNFVKTGEYGRYERKHVYQMYKRFCVNNNFSMLGLKNFYQLFRMAGYAGEERKSGSASYFNILEPKEGMEL